MSIGRRATVYNGDADMQEIVRTEVTGELPKGVQKDTEMLQEDKAAEEKEKTLIMGEFSGPSRTP